MTRNSPTSLSATLSRLHALLSTVAFVAMLALFASRANVLPHWLPTHDLYVLPTIYVPGFWRYVVLWFKLFSAVEAVVGLIGDES